jgi:hypothetical protein
MSYQPLKICSGDFAGKKKNVENKEFYMIKEGRVLKVLYFFYLTFFLIIVYAFFESIWLDQWSCNMNFKNMLRGKSKDVQWTDARQKAIK